MKPTVKLSKFVNALFIIILILSLSVFQKCGEKEEIEPDLYNCLEGINVVNFPFIGNNSTEEIICSKCEIIRGSAELLFKEDKNFELKVSIDSITSYSYASEIGDFYKNLVDDEINISGKWDYDQQVGDIHLVVSGTCPTWAFSSNDCETVQTNMLFGNFTLKANKSSITLSTNQINGTYSIECSKWDRSHNFGLDIIFSQDHILTLVFGNKESFNLLGS